MPLTGVPPPLSVNTNMTSEGSSWESNTMAKLKSTPIEVQSQNTSSGLNAGMKDEVSPKGKSAKSKANGGDRTRKMQHTPNEELTVMQTLFSKCLCSDSKFMFSSPRTQIELVSLDGIECIALGAVTDEHSARERVELTVTLLATRTDRLINVGYLKNISNSLIPPKTKEERDSEEDESRPNFKNIAEVMPIEAWKENAASSAPSNDSRSQDNHILPLDVGTVIEQIKQNNFNQAIITLNEILHHQRQGIRKGNNRLLEGITLHNIGVVYLLSGKFEQAFPCFQESVLVKQAAFGDGHPEVAVSLVETGILIFAKEKYEEALNIFNDALKIRIQAFGSKDPKVAMVLNNIACAHFEMGNPLNALATFKEAREIEQHALGSSQNANLDLLHVATTLSNIGYIQLQIKNYEEASGNLEDALLVQQSVLGDNHRTVQDTLSNIEFTNAFHS